MSGTTWYWSTFIPIHYWFHFHGVYTFWNPSNCPSSFLNSYKIVTRSPPNDNSEWTVLKMVPVISPPIVYAVCLFSHGTRPTCYLIESPRNSRTSLKWQKSLLLPYSHRWCTLGEDTGCHVVRKPRMPLAECLCHWRTSEFFWKGIVSCLPSL